MTGIESSDPWTGEARRNQLREAHNFYEYYSERLENIHSLGIRWVRFGPPYSETHLGPGRYDFALMDAVVEKCQQLGITIIADLLHFGLPDWLHADSEREPFFQNRRFPEAFAAYAEEFARRYETVSYFTPVNEPFVTANFSAKVGIWNERRSTPWHDDRPFVRAVANISRAAILSRQAIERVFRQQRRQTVPVFIQNESFEKAVVAPGSGREAEAGIFNLRKFAALDLITGHRDRAMKDYLLAQGLSKDEYAWFMREGSTRHMVLGIDYYPWNVHTLERDQTIDHDVSKPYELYDLTKEYYRRYKLPLIHTEINAWPDFAGSMCLLTFDALLKLRKEGYPILGMTWYGDEYQVGWHHGLVGPKGFEETPVGLYYKGQQQPVAQIFQGLAQHGFGAEAKKSNSFPALLKRYLKLFLKE